MSLRAFAFVASVVLLASCQSQGTGSNGTGGASPQGSGGRTATGGASVVSGTGGASSGGTGGTLLGSGGAIGTGGTTPTGGSGPSTGTGGSTTNTGGAPGTGGSQATGGASGMGGAGGLACTGANASGASFAVDTTGVTFTLSAGKEKIQVCQADIIRVEYTTASSIPTKTELSVSNPWSMAIPFCVSEASGTVTVTTSRMKVMVDEKTGLVSYADLNGAALLSEASKSLTAATVEGTSTNTVQTTFNSPTSEALFGLGQHQDGVINRKGSTLHMLNANTQIQIPVLVSNKGYGIFWDNYSTTDFAGNVGGIRRIGVE